MISRRVLSRPSAAMETVAFVQQLERGLVTCSNG